MRTDRLARIDRSKWGIIVFSHRIHWAFGGLLANRVLAMVLDYIDIAIHSLVILFRSKGMITPCQ
jgi:hypothetical protein